MIANRTALLLGLFAIALSSCVSSRAGWGRGRYVVLTEKDDLQIRRSRIELDPDTRDLRLNWVGARIPEGVEGQILEARLFLFDDRNGDQKLSPGELLFERSTRERVVKVLFDDVRVKASKSGTEILARIEVRTDRRMRASEWEMQVDP